MQNGFTLYEKIDRKLASTGMMVLLVFSVLIAGAPNTIPRAYSANANLFVSAENSQFQNYISGPQVTEVVVIDSDIKDTDKGKGEPDVTVNGNHLRMIQATDGNWYAYFADRDSAEKADSIQASVGTSIYNGVGLDFGSFCSNTSAGSYLGFTLTETSGVAIPISGAAKPSGSDVNGNINGGTITANCAGIGSTSTATNGTGVVREPKSVNPGTTGSIVSTVPKIGRAHV